MHQYKVNICLRGAGASWLTWKPSDKLFYNRNCYKLLKTTPCALNHQIIPLTAPWAQGYLADTHIWSCFTVPALISIISSSATAFRDGTALGICWWAVRLGLRNKTKGNNWSRWAQSDYQDHLQLYFCHWGRISAAPLKQPLAGNDSENSALDVHVCNSLITTSEKQILAGKATSKTPSNLFSLRANYEHPCKLNCLTHWYF